MPLQKPLLLLKQPEVGKLIYELRLLTGLTQEQFAAKLGVTYGTVNRWENVRMQPSPLALRQVEHLLGTMGDCGRDLLDKYSPADG